MDRYISSFDTNKLPYIKSDVLIVGAGIAGMYTALMLPKHLQVVVLAKGSVEEMSSYYAQGGIAAPIDQLYDSPKQHYQDTIICGKYYNTKEAVNILVNEANDNIKRLIELGIGFDCDEKGDFLLGKEGGHTLSRVLHIGGDQTGQEMVVGLRRILLQQPNITLVEHCFAIDLLTDNGGCYGILAKVNKEKRLYYSKVTVMATGGIGQMYERTTNPKGIQGDGIAMAIRAGAKLKDLDLVQFHPTAFFSKTQGDKRTFLISEAVRGEGAVLRNHKGDPFMEKIHPLKDLAPRDIVSMAISKEMRQYNIPCVYLDITHRSKAFLEQRFPTIYRYCKQQGLSMEKDLIPVAPVNHYFMGGIEVDLEGRTSIKHLYACGECACTGVHGKNRLASNSLLEAVVFSRRAAKEITKEVDTIQSINHLLQSCNSPAMQVNLDLDRFVRVYMMGYLGISKCGVGEQEAKQLLEGEWEKYKGYSIDDVEEIGIINKLTVAKTMLESIEVERVKAC